LEFAEHVKRRIGFEVGADFLAEALRALEDACTNPETKARNRILRVHRGDQPSKSRGIGP
jgi:hypothetical protein